MRSRILLGVGAWLTGAGAATGVSLVAVSALGQDMTPAASQQLSVNAVNRALVSQDVDRPATQPRPASPSVAPTARPSPSVPPTARPSPSALYSVPSPSPAATRGTVLTSPGGMVVAACAGNRAYLLSWSPGQGFESAHVVRGAAVTAQATFTSPQATVTMVVSCARGVPTATSSVTGSLSSDD